MRRLALGIAGLLAIVGGVSQASAQSVSWAPSNIALKNDSTVPIIRTFITNPSIVVTETPAGQLPAMGTKFVAISSATSPGTILSYTIQYLNLAGTRGCNFGYVGSFNRSTGRYSWAFSRSAVNIGGIGSAPVCTNLNNGVNATTGAFSAQAFVAGL